MTRDQLRAAILATARAHDAAACWATDEPDDNCLLVEPAAIVDLLRLDPEAYEDPNEPEHVTDGTHTRVVFPSIPADDA